MISKQHNSRKQKRRQIKNKQGNSRSITNITRTILRPLSTSALIVCTEMIAVSSVSGTADISFSRASVYSPSYDLNNLFTLTDFSETAEYEFCRLLNVTMEFVRSADETSMFNNVKGGSVLLTYYPILQGIAMPYSVTSRDQTSYALDLMTFDPQVITLPIYNIEYVGSSSGKTSNNTTIHPRNFFQDFDGQLSISSSNTSANIASVPLFSVKVMFT